MNKLLSRRNRELNGIESSNPENEIKEIFSGILKLHLETCHSEYANKYPESFEFKLKCKIHFFKKLSK